ncbi:MAG TPA: peptidylprolyl isomerase [Actinopolymorphaceae bacterium]
MVSKKQRRRQLARQKWERQQARRAERARRLRRRGIIVGAVLGVALVILAGWGLIQMFGGDDTATAAQDSPSSRPSSSPTPPAEPSTSAPTATPAPRPSKAGECLYVERTGADQKSVGLPPRKPSIGGSAQARLETSAGTITVALDGKAAPCGVNSFAFLAQKNLYDKTTCTGLTAEPADTRALECGDPTGSGAGGPGYIFASENTEAKVPAGKLVLADGGDRNGSRFMITYAPSTFERPVTVIGTVESGLDAVQKAAKDGFAEGSEVEGVGRPKNSVVIEDVEVAAPKP